MTGSPEGPASVPAPAASHGRAVLAWVALFVVFCALRVPGLVGNSATYDEPIYVGASMHWTALGDARAAAMLYHPPLAYHLIDLPLRAFDAPLRPWSEGGANTQVGLAVLYESTFRGGAVTPETVLLLARLPILLAGALALPLIFSLARRIGGVTAGWLAAAAWALFPEAAAQSIQATTDCVAATAALLLAWTAIRHAEMSKAQRPTRGSVALLGLATGLALLSKHTLLVHVAVVAAALVWMRTMTVRRALAVAGVAAAVVWAGYGFEFRAALGPEGGGETLGRVASAFGIDPETLTRAGRAVPLPAPTYVRSVADALLSKAGPRAGTTWVAYMDGAWSEQGFWTYFPYAVWVKTPVVLLALLLGLVHLPHALRARRDATLLLLALCVVPFAAAVVSRLNIGFRHLLPTMPFVWIVAAGAACVPRTALPSGDRTNDTTESLRRRRRVLAAFGVLVAAVVAIEIGPQVRDPIPFANALAGGASRLHERLADSNLEVGQDLGRVRAWAAAHDVRAITCVLHTSPGLYERECARDPRLVPYDVSPTGTVIVSIRAEDQTGPVPRDGLLAVGESVLVLPRWQKLLPTPPLAVVGRTRIYALPRP